MLYHVFGILYSSGIVMDTLFLHFVLAILLTLNI